MSSLKELRNLNGRCALITGANGSLGRVMADTLAELGADLILVDRCNLNFDELSKSLAKRWDVSVECLICDLEFQAERTELISHLKVSGRLINILINNAAFVGTSEISGWNVPFQQQTVETWRRAIEVNLTAIFDLTQGITPLLELAKGANIINIASIYGEYGPNWNLYEGTSMSNPAAYGVSKGGLIQLTRWLSTTISPNIRVNAISPGGVFRNQPKDFVERYKSRTPLARMATEDDFRGVIAFLASDLSAYITGQNIRVDGGWGVW